MTTHANHPDAFDSTCPTCWTRANDRADPLTSFEDEQPLPFTHPRLGVAALSEDGPVRPILGAVLLILALVVGLGIGWALR